MESVQAVAAELGLVVERRLAGGEFGAYAARTAAGEPVVLKLPPDHPRLSLEWVASAVEMATMLRADGFPIPRYLDVGTTQGRVYTVQEVVSGEVPDVIRPAHTRQLVELWRTHEGQAWSRRETGAQMAAEMVNGLRTGSETVFVDHGVLRATGDVRVLEVLDAAIKIGNQTDPDIFRTDDVVHGDFHGRNVLVQGDEIVAVFDWQGAHAGDSRTDLIRLAYFAKLSCDQPTGAIIAAEVAATVPAEVHAAITAQTALGGLTFAARSKPDALDHYVERAQTLLRGL